jgi:hypothetical protein
VISQGWLIDITPDETSAKHGCPGIYPAPGRQHR